MSSNENAKRGNLYGMLGMSLAIIATVFSEAVTVTLTHQKIHAADCDACETETGKIDRIERDIALTGDLSAAERQRLLEIADRCPVHKTLHGEVNVVSRLVD